MVVDVLTILIFKFPLLNLRYYFLYLRYIQSVQFSGFGHGQYCRNRAVSDRTCNQRTDNQIYNSASYKNFNFFQHSLCRRNLVKELRKRQPLRKSKRLSALKKRLNFEKCA